MKTLVIIIALALVTIAWKLPTPSVNAFTSCGDRYQPCYVRIVP